MSFVTAAPAQVQAAAQGLAGIRSTLAQASASVAAPTTGVVAAAQDEVSAGVAAFFGAFGQEYQFISAQTQALHEQYVNLLNAGAAAYLGTEVANAEQNLLGESAVMSGVVVGAAASGSSAVSAARLILGAGGGGLGPVLGGTPMGRSISGAVTALRNGGPATLLSGQPGKGLPTLPGNIAGLPAALTGFERSLAPAAMRTAASTSLAGVEGPYQTLVANTAANLQALGSAILANPAPFLDQLVINQAGYAQTIATGLQAFIQNLPAELANVPANIQAAVQALLAFNPAPYVQQFIDNQIAYAQIIATSLQNAAHDFGTGLMALPAAFQSAFQALQTGDIAGAVGDIGQGFANLFFTGFAVQQTGLTFDVSLMGAIGDLLPILTIPGQMAQNFTNLLPAGTIPAQISQNFTNVIDTLTDTSITATVTAVPLSLSATLGLPMALTFDAVGAPVNALSALGSSTTVFVDAVQAGNSTAAIGALIDAPVVITNGLLNGEMTVSVPVPVSIPLVVKSMALNISLDGILVPQQALTATVTPFFGSPFNLPVSGTPLGGIVPGLLVYAPEQLALAITPT
jgi:hypothetical protein